MCETEHAESASILLNRVLAFDFRLIMLFLQNYDKTSTFLHIITVLIIKRGLFFFVLFQNVYYNWVFCLLVDSHI